MPKEVPSVPAMSKVAIQQKVEQFLRENYPTAWAGLDPVPVEKIFEFDTYSLFGIDTGYTVLSERCGVIAYGYTNLEQKISYVDGSVADDTSVKGRRFCRSTIGHELGHCFLHVPLERWRESRNLLGLGLNRSIEGLRAFEDPEWQAWEFCKNLCMPAHLVQKFLERYRTGNTAIEAMVDHFDMSYLFVVARVKSLTPIKNSSSTATTALEQKYVRKTKKTRHPDRASM